MVHCASPSLWCPGDCGCACYPSIKQTHVHTHACALLLKLVRVLMPREAHGNYLYRPLRRYRSHSLSDKESNHNANKGKLSRRMEVMSRGLFLLPVALGEQKKKKRKERNPIISSNCIDCVLP